MDVSMSHEDFDRALDDLARNLDRRARKCATYHRDEAARAGGAVLMAIRGDLPWSEDLIRHNARGAASHALDLLGRPGH